MDTWRRIKRIWRFLFNPVMAVSALVSIWAFWLSSIQTPLREILISLVLTAALIVGVSIVVLFVRQLQTSGTPHRATRESFAKSYKTVRIEELRAEMVGKYTDLPYIQRQISRTPATGAPTRSRRIMILGLPGLGKSREAYELIKSKYPDATIIKPKATAIPIIASPSDQINKAVLYIDEVPRLMQGDAVRAQGDLEEAIKNFEIASYELAVVCTANRDELAKLPSELDSSSFWATFERWYLPRLDESQTAKLLDELAVVYGKNVSPSLKTQILAVAKNGTFGNLVLWFKNLGSNKNGVDANDLKSLKGTITKTAEAIIHNIVAGYPACGRVFDSMGVLYRAGITRHRRFVYELARLQTTRLFSYGWQINPAINYSLRLHLLEETKDKERILYCPDVFIESRGDFTTSLISLVRLTLDEDATTQNMLYPSLPSFYEVVKKIWHKELPREQREQILKLWIRADFFGGQSKLDRGLRERSKRLALQPIEFVTEMIIARWATTLFVVFYVFLLAVPIIILKWQLDRLEPTSPVYFAFLLFLLMMIFAWVIGYAQSIIPFIRRTFQASFRYARLLVSRQPLLSGDFEELENQFLSRYQAFKREGVAPISQVELSLEERKAIRQWLLNDCFPVKGSNTLYLWFWAGKNRYMSRTTYRDRLGTSVDPGFDRFPLEEHNAIEAVMLYCVRAEIVDHVRHIISQVRVRLHPQVCISTLIRSLQKISISKGGVFLLALIIALVFFFWSWPQLSPFWLEALDLVSTFAPSFLALALICALPLAIPLIMLAVITVSSTFILSILVRLGLTWPRQVIKHYRCLFNDHLLALFGIPERSEQAEIPTWARIVARGRQILWSNLKREFSVLWRISQVIVGLIGLGTVAKFVNEADWQLITGSIAIFLAWLIVGYSFVALIDRIPLLFRRDPRESDWQVVRRYRAEYSKYLSQSQQQRMGMAIA